MNRRCLFLLPVLLACFLGVVLPASVYASATIEGSTLHMSTPNTRIGGVELHLLNKDGTVVAKATSNENGRFYFEGLEQGSYKIIVLNQDSYMSDPSVTVGLDRTTNCQVWVVPKNGDTKGAAGGKLINGVTGVPIVDAQVAVYRQGDDSSLEATTDANGLWVIRGLESGTYQFFVDNPPTYYIQYLGVEFTSQPGYLDWKDVYTGPVEQGFGGLFGKVMDEYGYPVSGAEVTMAGSSGETYKLVTDENGVYGSNKVKPASKYEITPQKPGLETGSKGTAMVLDGFATNQHFTLFEPVVTGEVDGTITDSSTGKPVNGATVKLSNGVEEKTSSTGSDGKYTIKDLGTELGYKIEISKEGYHTTKRSGVEVKKTGPVTEDERIVPKIAGHGAIIGKLTVAGSGAPLAGVKISVVKQSDSGLGGLRMVTFETVATLTTDSEGNFTAPGLDPGPHSIHVHGLEKGYHDSGSQTFDIKECTAVVMVASLSSNTNSGVGGFRGKIIDASTNKGVPGATVKASNGTETKSIETNEKGVYRIPDLSPKKPWTLEISKEGYHKTNAKRIETRPGEEVVYDERLIQKIQGKGAIVGRVTEAPFDKPLEGVKVTVYQGVTNGTLTSFQVATTLTTDSDGNFNVSGLAPGKYYIEVDSMKFYKLATNQYEIKECNALVINVPLADKTVFGGGSVTGVLVDPETGKVIPQATVQVDSDPYGFEYPVYHPEKPAESALAWQTDDSGTFYLSGLEPDSTYTLTVTGAGLYTTVVRGIRVPDGTASVRTVYSSPVDNTATGAVGGRVTGTSGVEMAGACITLSPGGRTSMTDLDGFWSIRDVSPADDYTVTVSASGFPPKDEKNVKVAAGKMTNLNISVGNEMTLSPPTALTVTDNKSTTLTLKWNLSLEDSVVAEYKLYRSCRDIFREPVIPAARLTTQAALIAAEKDSTVYIGSVPGGTATYVDSPAQIGATYIYWIQAVSVNGFSELVAAAPVVGVEEKVSVFRVSGFYPNPFNPTASIEYSIPVRSSVMLDIYDVLGRKVVNLEDRVLPAGSHVSTWNGRDSRGNLLGSGVYLYRLRAGAFVSSGKVMMLR